MENVQSLLTAVNTLIATDRHTFMAEAIEAVAAMNTRYPVQFADKLAVLNPLLQLRIEDANSFEKVKQLVDSKRHVEGLPPVWPGPEKEKFDKVEYQRQLMATRRRIAKAALEIENAQRPERDKLIGTARLEFENKVLADWGAELERQIEEMRDEAGGRLSKEATSAFRKQYWAGVEASLEERHDLLRKELLKPIHMRRKV